MTAPVQILLAAGGAIAAGWVPWSITGSMTAGANPLGATYILTLNGFVTTNLNGNSGGTTIGTTQWFVPGTPGIGGSYWVRATVTAGAADSGTFGVWQRLDVNRSFGIADYLTAGAKSCTIKFEFATDAAGSNIVLTGAGNTINLTHA